MEMNGNDEFQQSLAELRGELETNSFMDDDVPEEKPQPKSKITKEITNSTTDPDSDVHLTEKQKLVRDCWELYSKIIDAGGAEPENKLTQSKLSKLNMTKLKEKLAELTKTAIEVETKNQILAKDSGSVPHPNYVVKQTPATKAQTQVESRVNNAEIVAEQLFHFNLIVTQFIELAGSHEKIKGKTGVDLTGLTESVTDDKDSLLPVLERVYLENADKLEGLLSPLNQYLLFMGRHVGSVAAENRFYRMEHGNSYDDSEAEEDSGLVELD